MTIADKLSYLQDTKTAIKEALLNKGVEVTDSDTFRSYADKIESISESAVAACLPKNIRGLDYLLDGEYNLITGSDHTNLNVYNLIKPSYNDTITGQRDVTNGVVSFTSKSFRPAGTYFLPKHTATEWTYDFVIKLTEAPFDWINYAGLIHSNSGSPNGGFSIHIDTDTKALTFMASTSSATNALLVTAPNTWDMNTINYWSVTSNTVTGETKLYCNGAKVAEAAVPTSYQINSSDINTGLFGAQSTTVTSSAIPTSSSNFWQNGAFHLHNADVYIVRHWNRILSDTDIKENYTADYNRINNIEPEPMPAVSVLNPSKTAGLCLWLDGQCNTRQGNDHSKKYLENLCWNNINSTVNGNLEYFSDKNVNVWVGDFLKLNSYAYYPYIYSDNISIEAVVKLGETSQAGRSIFTSAYNSGFALLAPPGTNNRFTFQCSKSTSAYEILNASADLDIPYYVAGVFDYTNKLMSLTVIGGSVNETQTLEITSPLVYKTSTNIGCGTNANTSTAINQIRYEGLSIAMIRCWSRALAQDEIQDNYKDVKQRFNLESL